MPRFIIRFSLFLCVLYMGLCVAMYWGQDSLLYYSVQASHQSDRNVEVQSLNGERIVVVKGGPSTPSNEKVALLYFGGNAEDVSLSLPQLTAAFPAYSLYAMHYRSYGGSSGRPSQAHLFADALALYDLLKRDHPQVLVMGRSLGSGIATYVASQRAVKGLILVTPYFSLERVAKDQYPYLPVGLLLRDKYESFLYAPKVSAPVLMLVAELDQLTPLRGSLDLQRTFKPGLANLVVINQAGHNSISNRPEYLEALRRF